MGEILSAEKAQRCNSWTAERSEMWRRLDLLYHSHEALRRERDHWKFQANHLEKVAARYDAALSAPKEGRNPHSASEDGSNREVSQAGDSVAQSVQESEPGVDRCPTCGSDNRAVWITGTPQNPDRERCPDPWHSAPKEGNDG